MVAAAQVVHASPLQAESIIDLPADLTKHSNTPAQDHVRYNLQPMSVTSTPAAEAEDTFSLPVTSSSTITYPPRQLSPAPRSQIRRNALAVLGIHSREDLTHTANFVAGCLGWYVSSSLTSNSAKAVLSVWPIPVTLIYVQFVVTVGLCYVYCRGLKRAHLVPFDRPIAKRMAPLSLVQVANHMLGTVAISHSPVSLVHTIKSLTPLFIVAFYWAFHNAKYSRSTIVSLYMLVFGVGLTCYKAASLTLIGFAYSLMASIAYACGTILNKKLLGSGRQQQQQQQQQRVGKLSIIFHTSIMSMIFLIPVWLGSGEQNVIHSIFAAQTVLSGRPRHLIWLVLFNSLVHFAQVILSIKLLSMTTAVSYSIASLFKRVFVIVVAIVWFRQSVTATQAFGLIVTFCGLYLYDRAKASSFPPTARLPLPSSTSASASGEASASDIDLGKPWGRRGED